MTIQILKKIALAGIVGLAGLLNGCKNSELSDYQFKEENSVYHPAENSSDKSSIIGIEKSNK